MKNELFIIPPDTLSAVLADKETLYAIVDDLKQLNLLKLPYPKVDVQIAVEYPKELIFPKGTKLEEIDNFLQGRSAYVRVAKKPSCMSCTFVGLDIEGNFERQMYAVSPPEFIHGVVKTEKYKIVNNFELSKGLAHILVVLLATKNTVKVTKEHKLAKLGIGAKTGPKSYPRVTTISLPSTLEPSKDAPPTGQTRCPHLRRGHQRKQKYGPKLAFTRSIWIEPIFVNADPDFVSTRKAYNLSFSQNPSK